MEDQEIAAHRTSMQCAARTKAATVVSNCSLVGIPQYSRHANLFENPVVALNVCGINVGVNGCCQTVLGGIGSLLGIVSVSGCNHALSSTRGSLICGSL